jgi:hypothetical protein
LVADRLKQRVIDVNAEALLNQYAPDESGSSQHIETVLASIRALSHHEYAGWLPTLGKNRTVGMVEGHKEVIHLPPSGKKGKKGKKGVKGAVYRGDAESPEPVDEKDRPLWRVGPGLGARVGVLDTGLSPHDWFKWAACSCDPGSEVHGDSLPAAAGHATFITGLVLRNAASATVEVRRVLDDDSRADTWDCAKAIVDFGNSGLDVLNLSFACYTDDNQPPMAMAAAIDRLDREVVVVAAAGNHASMRASGEVAEGTPPVGVKPAWPAALDDVIAVGASAPAEGQLADFSPDAPWVDLCTEGVDIVSTFLPNAVITQKSQNELKAFGGSFARWNGTSFSAALVSGAIAACVEPGRTTARQALDQLMREVNDEGELRLGRSKIPFLPLLNRH